MILIHTALLSEAQSFIEKYKLSKINNNPKIYTNTTQKIIVVISGIGKDNTINALEYIFSIYQIHQAINVGIAGSSDTMLKIGEIFCTNKQLDDIKFKSLVTVDTPCLKNFDNVQNTLYDMEGKYFNQICLKYLKDKNIFIFKIISDYLDDTILPKDKVKQMIKKSMEKMEKYIC